MQFATENLPENSGFLPSVQVETTIWMKISQIVRLPNKLSLARKGCVGYTKNAIAHRHCFGKYYQGNRSGRRCGLCFPKTQKIRRKNTKKIVALLLAIVMVMGIRSLSELDAFMEELKGMGIEDYIAMHEEAYPPFMDSIFG